MKKLVLTAATVVAMGVASLALAGGQEQAQVKRGGFYIGGGLGYADLGMPTNLISDQFIDSARTAQSSTLNHFTAGAHVGYLFPVTQQFLLGAELGYNYLPNTTYTITNKTVSTNNDTEIKFSRYSLDLMGVAKYYVVDQFNVFAKAGVSYVKQKASADATVVVQGLTLDTASVSKSSDQLQPKLAVGAGYNVLPNLELTAEYSHTFGDKFNSISQNSFDSDNNLKESSVTNIASNNAVLVGVNYYFN